jgi:hypothetical protein
MSGQEEKIQIVAFSTNDTQQTPNDVINMFLENNNHLILKKSRHAIAFSTTLANSNKSSKIMVCSVLNLTREYTGITDVNCYILFIDLEKEESKEKFETILNYAKDYCELTKKIYVLGMVSGNDEETKHITKGDITKTLDSAQVAYEYKEINLSKAKEVSDTIMDVLVYSSKHSISGEETKDKEGGQAGSCEIF